MTTKSSVPVRYSLAIVLILILAAAAIFAGFRFGFDEGYSSGEHQRTEEEPYAAVYTVSELVAMGAENDSPASPSGALDLLMMAIQSTVAPNHWEALGGPGTMAPSPHQAALIVNATPPVHRQLESMLSDLGAVQATMRAVEQERRQANDAFLAGLLDPVAEQLGEELEPLPAGTTLSGVWEIKSDGTDDVDSIVAYEFTTDQDSLGRAVVNLISTAEEGVEPESRTYTVSASGQMMLAGRFYCAATKLDGSLVLISVLDPSDFSIATKR